MTLRDLQAHFTSLYGARARLFFWNPLERIGVLNIRIGDLQHLLRNSASLANPPYDVALRRIFVRLCSVAELFDLSLAACLMAKFPLRGCGYCGQLPCICPDLERDDHQAWMQPGSAQDTQLQWGLREWSAHLQNVYGTRPENQSLEMITLRLFRESSELSAVIAGVRTNPHPNEEIYRQIGGELADVFAWLIAAANMLHVDLESVTLMHYLRGCPHCQHCVCVCKPGHPEPEDWRLPRYGSGP